MRKLEIQVTLMVMGLNSCVLSIGCRPVATYIVIMNFVAVVQLCHILKSQCPSGVVGLEFGHRTIKKLEFLRINSHVDKLMIQFGF